VRHLLDLTGRAVVVTGAAGGIGAAIAARVHEAGAAVLVHARRPAAAAAVCAALGERAAPVVADLRDPDAPAVVVDAALHAFGRLDGLVNNAAVQPVGALLELADAELDEVLDTNVGAVFRLTRAVAAHLADAGRHGAVVTVASIEGEHPPTLHAHYAASKAAVLMHTRAAAGELGRLGIRVNAVAPGLIDRPGLQADWPEGVARWHAAAPLGRLGHPADVADAVLFLLSDAARWITGATLRVDGGVLARPTW
jgi:NAD(P)-dependent dehydrogenase (short-subunit alcohol dehydrogenase family)